MAAKLLVFVLLGLPLAGRAATDHPFAYHDGEEGPLPSQWGNVSYFPQCNLKNFRRQSPINIITNKVTTTKDFFLTHYTDDEETVTIVNNGHTLKVTVASTDSYVQPPGVDDRYIFHQLHFHWGQDGPGSEHMINGERYDGEMHIVHYNEKYGGLTEAVNHQDGVLVIGIFLTAVANETSVSEGTFTELSKILVAVTEADLYIASDTTTTIDNFQASFAFSAGEETGYYRYPGSLTTPPCNNVVEWLVIKRPREIYDKHLQQLRSLRYKTGATPVAPNYRTFSVPINDVLAGRTVYSYSQRKHSDKGEIAGASVAIALLTCSVISFYWWAGRR